MRSQWSYVSGDDIRDVIDELEIRDETRYDRYEQNEAND